MRRAALVISLLLLTASLGSLAPAASAQSSRSRGAPPELLERPLRGPAAVRALGDDLPEVARRAGRSPARLAADLASDDTMWVDQTGQVFYVEPLGDEDDHHDGAGPASSEREVDGLAFPQDIAAQDAFALNSRPGADRVVFLDFDGHTVSGTQWNVTAPSLATAQPPFDRDGNPSSFSAAELDVIRGVWLRVAEDFAPFNVNVTTQDPGPAAISRSSTSDPTYGTRVLVTTSTASMNALCSSGCGGVAYVNVFNRVEPDHSRYQPAWVFANALSGTGATLAKHIAEAATHEAGHNLSLSHDGTSSSGYYSGHAMWAPIMGVGYSRPVTQWSRGEYHGANNSEDDLARIANAGAPLRADDHGNTRAAATSLGARGTGGPLTATGVISTRTDVDVFAWTQTCAGATPISVLPASTSPNLDVRLRVFDGDGAVLATVDPAAAFVSAQVANGLAATTSLTLPAGAFAVEVDGTGVGDPLSTGYSDYGSLGAYTVEIGACTGGTTATAPAPPTSVSATAGMGQITVGFAAGDDGGSPITSFTATCTSDAGAASSASGVGSPLVVTSVIDGVYRCTVTATNAFGTSAASTSSPAVTLGTVPGVPESVSASAGPTSATVTFSPPASDGGSSITSYDAQCTSSTGGATRTVNTVRSPVTVTNLTAMATYTCQVRANNAFGPGAWSTPSNSVKPRKK